MNELKIAIPVFNNRISPLFDVAGVIEIYNVSDSNIEKVLTLKVSLYNNIEKSKMLVDENVNVVICSAISCKFSYLIMSNNIILISGIIGDTSDVVSSYRSGNLNEKRFIMPGCRKHGKNHLAQGRRNKNCLYRNDVKLDRGKKNENSDYE